MNFIDANDVLILDLVFWVMVIYQIREALSAGLGESGLLAVALFGFRMIEID